MKARYETGGSALSWVASGLPPRPPSGRVTARAPLVASVFRVELHLPEAGRGPALAAILTWLHEDLAGGDLVRHGGMVLGGDRVSIDFPRLEDAARFLQAFPDLKPVGGTDVPDRRPTPAPKRR